MFCGAGSGYGTAGCVNDKTTATTMSPSNKPNSIVDADIDVDDSRCYSSSLMRNRSADEFGSRAERRYDDGCGNSSSKSLQGQVFFVRSGSTQFNPCDGVEQHGCDGDEQHGSVAMNVAGRGRATNRRLESVHSSAVRYRRTLSDRSMEAEQLFKGRGFSPSE